VLAAGLVLGFSLLIPKELRHAEAQVAFSSAQDVLRTLSRISPQAQRNLSILSSFSDAISSYNQKLGLEAAPPSSALLERILPRSRSSQLATATPGMTSAGCDDFPALMQDFGQPEALLDGIGGQATDEIGFQQFWDQYTNSYPVQADSATDNTPEPPWSIDDACV